MESGKTKKSAKGVAVGQGCWLRVCACVYVCALAETHTCTALHIIFPCRFMFNLDVICRCWVSGVILFLKSSLLGYLYDHFQ